MRSVQFKDFQKESKDLLSKNYTQSGYWKLESKAPLRSEGALPTITTASGDSNGRLSADLEWRCPENGIQGKLTVTPKDLNDLKGMMSATFKGHKVELTVHHKGDRKFNVEVNHSTSRYWQGRVSMNNKVTMDAVEFALSVLAVPKYLQIGTDAIYTAKSKECNWNIGCVAAAPIPWTGPQGTKLSVRTNRFENYTVGLWTRAPFCPKFKPNFAIQGTCTPANKKWKLEGGMELPCPVCPGNTLKVKADAAKNWAVAYILKLPERWTMAVSIDKNLKSGVTFTHE